jgi:putative (di)nucleoside polyphosphate hydrolase
MKKERFRASVGAMIVDRRGKVLACDRADVPEEAWQMPQGGIRRGEEPLEAVWRELAEETGLARDAVDLIAELSRWIAYELPEPYRSRKTGRGQVQKWFLFRARARAPDARPDGAEFRACRWMAPQDLLRQTADFRRPVYSEVFDTFLPLLGPRRGDP